jgi:Host cell surface-exposed lipoprotein
MTQPGPNPQWAQQQQAPKPRRKKWPWVLTALVALLIIGSCVAGGDEVDSTPASTSTSQETGDPSTEGATTASPRPEKTKPKLSVSQQQAIGAAESYLDSGGYSRKSLIAQLKYEGFSTKEAEYAVDHVKVNWNDEAEESAESYMDSGSYSRKSLLAQLKYEGFTDAQAAHGVKSVGL